MGIAGIITALLGWDSRTFWKILPVLVLLGIMFEGINFMVGVVKWRIWGRRFVVDNYLQEMRKAKMPRRFYSSDNGYRYLHRIESGVSYKSSEVRPEALTLTTELIRQFDVQRDLFGMISDLRGVDAFNRALDLHSPRENSPPFVDSETKPWLNDIVTEERFCKLPHVTPTLSEAFSKARPFNSLLDIWDFLRGHGLPYDKAVELFIHASFLSVGKAPPALLPSE